ncbi:MAG: DNA-binding response regulator [Bacteroidetes bacterium]|nr:MAG: DNA-binding response regulator [Bacteroidota bacterium]MBL1145337.1 DNA-binding response regulator [Bacteroidota bacterium]NOG58135.1 response regulator transcription factor [Bacteroidota bacterium]
MKLSVCIVEDEKHIREGIALFINESDGFSCEHTYSNSEQAIKEIPLLGIDVVLMDINLPGISGIKCVEYLNPICPKTQFLMFTSFDDSDSVFNALKVGANGYITKTTTPLKLLDAIIDIHKGGSPMSSHIARKIVNSFQATKTNSELKKLSTREIEILDLLDKGYRYKEIANHLFISTETVRTHIRNIYEKLQVNSRTEAINKTHRL